MNSPKTALEACIEELQTLDDGFSDRTIALAKAAIPVAELHQEIVELLEDYGKRGVNMPIGVILNHLALLATLRGISPGSAGMGDFEGG